MLKPQESTFSPSYKKFFFQKHKASSGAADKDSSTNDVDYYNAGRFNDFGQSANEDPCCSVSPNASSVLKDSLTPSKSPYLSFLLANDTYSQEDNCHLLRGHLNELTKTIQLRQNIGRLFLDQFQTVDPSQLALKACRFIFEILEERFAPEELF